MIVSDFDGYSSASIIYKYLSLIFYFVQIVPLFHSTKMHGLADVEIMDKILKDKPNLVICPDSSSGDFKQHKILKDNGIKCIILDHHPCDKYSKNAIVVNNKLSPKVVNKEGSGCLVSWTFLKYLDKQLGYNYAPTMIDVVYFSLLADSCDMSSMENNSFAYYGRNFITNKLLVQTCELLTAKEINSAVILWEVIPKLSAIIRSTNDEVKEALFYALATEEQKYIDVVLSKCKSIHSAQNKVVKTYVNNHIDDVDSTKNIIFERADDICASYRGLVASRYVNTFNRPVLLYRKSDDEYIGSIRSNIPIKQILKDSGVFTFIAGHDAACACGFTEAMIPQIEQYISTLDIDTSEQVCYSYKANSIPKSLFVECDKLLNHYAKGVENPRFHICDIVLNGKDILQLGKYGTTIKFTINGISYSKQFCSKVWKAENYIGENQMLSLEIIGAFELYNNQPNINIEKMETTVIVVEPKELVWENL